MKKLLALLLLIPSLSFANKYQHKFSHFICEFGEKNFGQLNNDMSFKIKIYDFEYQDNFDEETFFRDINKFDGQGLVDKNYGLYSGNMGNNSCKYDLETKKNLNCWTSIGYDLINVFLPHNGRRVSSLITIFPDESALIYKSQNSNVPFSKYKDAENPSKGTSLEFKMSSLLSLHTGVCLGTNK